MNALTTWEPGEDLFVRFDDKTEEDRTDAQLKEMLQRMTAVANEYDFDLWGFGSWQGARELMARELAVHEAFDQEMAAAASITTPPNSPGFMEYRRLTEIELGALVAASSGHDGTCSVRLELARPDGQTVVVQAGGVWLYPGEQASWDFGRDTGWRLRVISPVGERSYSCKIVGQNGTPVEPENISG